MAHILELSLFNFRNFKEQQIRFCPEFTFIFGQNASGKTSLLEAIYLLSSGKSFRTNNAGVCINHLSDEYVIRAQISNILYYPDYFWLALQRGRNGLGHYKVANNIENKLSNFVKYLPVQFIDINSYKIIEEGPVLRREYLDWLLFHTVADYAEIWQRMKKSLEQRNILLKSPMVDLAQLELWSKSFILYAEMVDHLRQELVQKLAKHLTTLIQQYYAIEQVEITYSQGFDVNYSLAQNLNLALKQDLLRKNTSVGPQKADLIILINNHPVKEVFSRGQIKLLTFLMMQARVMILQKKSVFLIDDLASELDQNHSAKILNSLANLQCQVIITALESEVSLLLDPKINQQRYLLQNTEFIVP
jgi:DNA replication and repair protein RecF